MNNIFPMLIFLMALAVFLRLDWIYYLVYVLGGTWIFSHWWVQRSLAQITVIRHAPEQAFSGETVNARMELVNRSWLPLPWLRIQEAVTNELKGTDHYQRIITLGGHSRTQVNFELYCRKRGYYPLGPVTLRTGDLFGFAESDWTENSPRHMTVYPRVLPISALGLDSRAPFGSLRSQQRLFQDPTRMSGVRAYAAGDSLRHIHWKASAREDQLLVKKFQPAIALDVMLVLDLNQAAYPFKRAVTASEWAIEIAASVASYITEQRQAVGLISNGTDRLSGQDAAAIPARAGRGNLMSVLTLLARVQTQHVEASLGRWLPPHLLDLSWGSTLVVVTPRLDEESLWMLHGLSRRGLTVVCLICTGQEKLADLRSRAKRLGIQIHPTLYEDQLTGAKTAARPGGAL